MTLKLTKAEMEDIWNNKPIGYFKSLVTSKKKLKKYKVSITPFKTQWFEKKQYEVLAKNKADAEDQARLLYMQQVKKEDYEGFRYFCLEV